MEPTAPMVLTKILASAFTIHGNHFTVLKHLHPSDAEAFHTDSIASTFVKIANYAKQERISKVADVKTRYAKKRAQCLSIFKCLILLLGPVVGRGALAIKTALKDAMDQTGIEPTPNRMWEPLRAYEKRLLLIASKDSNIRAGASRVVKAAERIEEQEEEGTERSPSPTPATNNTRGAGSQAVLNGNDQDEEEVEVEGEDQPADDDPDADAELDLGLDDPALDFDLDLDNLDSPAGTPAASTPGRKRSGSVNTGTATRANKRTKK